MAQSSERFEGSSDQNFTAAAIDAVARGEAEDRLQPGEEGIVLRVLEMEVFVHGPIGEYRIVLGP